MAPNLPWMGGEGGTLDIAAAIIAAYASVDWVVPDLFLTRASDVSLVSGAVETWANNGLAADATQGTSTARPGYSASALNSRPGLTFDGADMLSRAAYDMSAYTALVHHVIFVANSVQTAITLERSVNSGTQDGGTAVTLFGASSLVRASGRGNGVSVLADSTAEQMLSPHVISSTYNQALAANEIRIRRDGTDVTSAPSGGNTSGGLGNHALFIGARSGISTALNGTIAAVITACGTTAIPLAAVASVEAQLKAHWGTP
jgi:hypothetical protein